MLTAIQKALSIKARTNAAISRDIARNSQTVTAWFSGRMYVPLRVRTALDIAIGSPVDWHAYEGDFLASPYRDRPKTQPRSAPAAAPVHPAPPQTSPDPENRPVATPRRLTATPPPARKPATRAPAPPIAPAPASGFLSRLFSPPSEDLFQ